DYYTINIDTLDLQFILVLILKSIPLIYGSCHRLIVLQRESCPNPFIHNVLDWNTEDPEGKPLEKVREIRDVIESRIKELVTSLSQTSQQINF
ncbi:MAG: hypothetical protein WBE34_04120, partial [Candidatus Nitrosopolaris sp.]